jgi:hypothetical protein
MKRSTKIPAKRTVAVLTPLVFAPFAGAVSVAAAKYLPGVTIDQGSLERSSSRARRSRSRRPGLWMKGWQAHEQREGGAHVATAATDLDDGDESFVADPPDTIDDDDGSDLDLDLDDEPEPDFDFDFGEDEEDDGLMALSSAPEE